LNAAVPIGVVTSVATYSRGAVRQLIKVSFNEFSWRNVRTPSLAESVAAEAVEAGTMSSEAAATVSAASATVSKVALPVTASALGLWGGFLGACR